MAALVETSFASLLAADSDAVLPADDAGVIRRLVTYGVKFSKAKLPATNLSTRLNLLAGLMWLHAHSGDLAPARSKLSPLQHQVLAVSLNLEYSTRCWR